MNKKSIIGAIVGGFLIFIWQFLSWTMLNIHGTESKYSAQQDTIMTFLSNHLNEEGSYRMPTFPPGSSAEDQSKLMESSVGKPWAQISYHKALNMSMGMNMVRGFLVDVFAVWLLFWLLLKIPNMSLQTAVISCVVVGLTGYFTTDYTYSIWYHSNSIPDLIDAVVSWSICGAWLGWWSNR